MAVRVYVDTSVIGGCSMQKSFDCVKMMRDIRAGLSKRYAEHPELLEEDMAKIHRKYGFPEPARKPKPCLVAEKETPYGASKSAPT